MAAQYIVYLILVTICCVQKSLEWMTERCDDLIVETREMFVDILNPFAKMKLIDALQRLGVSYHFKEEIDNSLESLVSVKFANDDFHAISLQFRLLRQQRRYMPCGIVSSLYLFI